MADHPEGTELTGAAVTLAEKLLVRLPETGAVITLAALSPRPTDHPLTHQLALALQTISSRPALVVRAGNPRDPARAARPAVPAETRLGLTDILAGTTTLDRALSSSRDEEPPRVGFGTRQAEATELLVSEALRSFLRTTLARFHWVLLDCPDLLEQRHAASLVARSTAVVGTLEAGHGQARSVRALKELCAGVNRPLAGVILT